MVPRGSGVAVPCAPRKGSTAVKEPQYRHSDVEAPAARGARLPPGSGLGCRSVHPPTTTNPRIEKWKGWIDGPIKDDVIGMHDARATWTHVGAMLAANPALPNSHWWEFMRDSYATTQAVAVRRQAVPDNESRNLGTLLAELADDCALVTQEFWVGLWRGHVDMRGMGRRKWAEQFGGEVGTHLDPAIVRQDIERLKAGSARVKRHVDRHIAHSDRKASPADVAALSDVHEAIDLIGELFRRYLNLFTASSMLQLEPVIPYDWMAVFRIPWMPAGWSPEPQHGRSHR